jgi:hypothetical protein
MSRQIGYAEYRVGSSTAIIAALRPSPNQISVRLDSHATRAPKQPQDGGLLEASITINAREKSIIMPVAASRTVCSEGMTRRINPRNDSNKTTRLSKDVAKGCPTKNVIAGNECSGFAAFNTAAPSKARAVTRTRASWNFVDLDGLCMECYLEELRRIT